MSIQNQNRFYRRAARDAPERRADLDLGVADDSVVQLLRHDRMDFARAQGSTIDGNA